MPEPVGLALIGAGAIAERHLQAYSQIGGMLPLWVVSIPAQSAEDFAHRWGFARSGTTIEPALADPRVQLVLITSPSPLHCAQALEAVRAGKDVVVEIPVAMNGPDAVRLAETAARLQRRVWVCHTLRSTMALRLVRERIRSGQLKLTHITGYFGIPRRRNQGMGGIGTRTWIDNLLWHHGCHQVDAALWVLGMPAVARVQALFGPVHPTLGMNLDVGLQMVTDSGTLITHSLSYNVEQPLQRLQFIGHEDVLTYEDGRLTNERGDELVAQPPANDLVAQNRELLRALHSGEPCEFDLATVLPTMQVLEQAQKSADSPAAAVS